MITIAFNEDEQGQDNEELENLNTSSDQMMSDNQKEKLNETKDKAKDKAKDASKKLLKNPKVSAFIIANIVPILIVIGIILLILILIGLLAFLTAMPGMILEKIKDFARSIWGDFVGFFTGDSITATVSKDDVLNLAQYIENMGYDIESCGFGKAVYEDASGEDKNKTKKLKSIGKSVDGKEYLKAYIAANEATYVLATFSLNGFLTEMGSKIVAFVKSDPDQVVDDKEVSTGMINILDKSGWVPDERFVKIDRKNEKMTLYTDAIYLPIIGALTDAIGVTNNGSIQWGSMFSYDMSSWTSKYGKPVELFLSVHLSTMMPDLAYRIAKDKELNTKINIVLQNINVSYITEIKSIGGNVANITNDQIINAFLDYGIISLKYKDTEEEETEEESEDQTTNEISSNTTEEEETEEKVGKSYKDYLESTKNQQERNELFKFIIQMLNDNFDKTTTVSFISNEIMEDVLYIKRGDEQVPGLDSITYDDLLELANIIAQGLGDGIKKVKWPYIQSVTKHWYYNDIDFTKGVYRKVTSAKKKIKYESEDKDNSALSKHNIEVELDATLTSDKGIVYQVCEPEATGPNKHIVEIFKDQYYKYDGTATTAKQIENAKLYDKYGTAGVVEDNGVTYTIEDNPIEKEEVSFEGNKSNALAAFSILENMHSEEGEFVYRSLKDLVVTLNYFTKDELTSDLKNAMLWLIKTDNKNEDFKVGKDANEYGMVIEGVGGREVIAPENCEVSEEDGVVTLKFTKMSDSTVELLKFIYEKDYKRINPDILVGLTMKIKGLKNVQTGSAQRGKTIGIATGDINAIMFDIDKSIVEDVEEYMVQRHNNAYEASMYTKMTTKEEEKQKGIDIERIGEDGYHGQSNNSTYFDPNQTLESATVAEQEVYNKLRELGYSHAGACAIMGCMKHESNFNLNATNSADGGFGLLQWTNTGYATRRDDLINYCQDNGLDYSSLEGQLEFFEYELYKTYSKANGYTYPVYETLKSSSNLEKCLEMFFCHDECGVNVILSSEPYAPPYNMYSTQDMFDMRLTEANKYYKYF